MNAESTIISSALILIGGADASQIQQEKIQIQEKSWLMDTIRQMSRDEIKKKVYQIISENLRINKSKIKDNITYTDLGFDSLDTVEIIIDLEKEFRIRIDNSTAEKIQTVGQTVDAVYNLFLKKE